MERKIGEIFEYNNEWYQCVEGTNCRECDFSSNNVTCDIHGEFKCTCKGRSDETSVVFKKLEKVGEPFACNYYGDARLVMMQEYQLFDRNITYRYSTPPMLITNYKNNRIAIEIKQDKEDMKENNEGNTPLNELTDKYVNGNIGYDEFEKEVKALYLKLRPFIGYDEFEKELKALYDKEESKPILKEFSLEAAKLGKPVCTRDGKKARIVCFDAKGTQPIVALVTCGTEEKSVRYKISGRFRFDGTPDEADLMMLPEKKEGWVNVYREDDLYTTSEEIYESKEEAIKSNPYEEAYLTTVKIEWEE